MMKIYVFGAALFLVVSLRLNFAQGTPCFRYVNGTRVEGYQCRNHKKWCIPKSWVCDGFKNCPEGDDEERCPTIMPPTSKTTPCKGYLCRGKKSFCIPSSFVCDGEVDCPQGDDEMNCTRSSARVCEDKIGSAECARMKLLCKKKGTFGDLVRKSCQKTCGLCHDPTVKPKPTHGPKPTRHPTAEPGPSPSGCGVSPVHGLGIINGHEAIPGAYPWIVSLQYYFGHFCGGTLLNSKWVLTAAHCTKGMTPSKVGDHVVVLGSHNHMRRESSVQRRHIKRVIRNPAWLPPRDTQADMALLELDRPVTLNKRVNIPCMPKTGVYPPLGKECIVAGWGNTKYPGRPTTILQETKLPVVEGKKCNHNNNVVCVGKGFGKGPDGKQWPNACKGDSGGPLVCQRSDGRWVLEGVTSFVYTYCKYYTGFSPVNQYIKWINSYIKS